MTTWAFPACVFMEPFQVPVRSAAVRLKVIIAAMTTSESSLNKFFLFCGISGEPELGCIFMGEVYLAT